MLKRLIRKIVVEELAKALKEKEAAVGAATSEETEQRIRDIAREEALKVQAEKEAADKAAQMTNKEFVESLIAYDKAHSKYETYEQTRARLGLKPVSRCGDSLD